MPCKDTTALMTVRVDHSDFLINYDYTKISCAKAIGNGQSFQQYCEGKPIQQILEWEFFQILQDLQLPEEDSENQFLVYLEWSALRSALIQYLGREDDVDTEHFEVASVEYDEQEVQIIQVIRPNTDMPKIQSCFKRSRKVPS
ncbi:MAG: iron-sulfur cluster assembly scaffold protein [Nitrospinaceae bacterium]